jgi:hypothetical protein
MLKDDTFFESDRESKRREEIAVGNRIRALQRTGNSIPYLTAQEKALLPKELVSKLEAMEKDLKRKAQAMWFQDRERLRSIAHGPIQPRQQAKS